MARKGERVSVSEDDDEDIYDPKSRGFCRACVDLSKFGLTKAKEMVSKPSVVPELANNARRGVLWNDIRTTCPSHRGRCFKMVIPNGLSSLRPNTRC
ncbi:unnamed protein product [Schistosoma mattheei]|uniref:Uncharacterized protein n=1 Tax=Schistosoma mattheei TaxID=31246 RepID=A0A183Q120_9TREM|nr:unnamed protein product [Schistosoma mattheei]